MNYLMKWLTQKGVDVHVSEGVNRKLLTLTGNTSEIDTDILKSIEIVDDVKRITEPYKSSNRACHPRDTVVRVGNAAFGGGNFSVIAGPCSVESKEQVLKIAQDIKKSGAGLLRGGAFKPRTSPYSFQGLRENGLKILAEVSKETGMPVVSEIMEQSQLPLFEDIDVIQVGARNMQNYELLKELGRTKKPILLKRGLSCTLQELLMSAEYLMMGGNENIILCERGIRTFETTTRNTLDLSAVPMLKEMTHLPVIVDPSHGTGLAKIVPPMALAAVAAGADGVMIEVHNDPANALCDGAQSITPSQFDTLMKQISKMRECCYKYDSQKEE